MNLLLKKELVIVFLDDVCRTFKVNYYIFNEITVCY